MGRQVDQWLYICRQNTYVLFFLNVKECHDSDAKSIQIFPFSDDSCGQSELCLENLAYRQIINVPQSYVSELIWSYVCQIWTEFYAIENNGIYGPQAWRFGRAEHVTCKEKASYYVLHTDSDLIGCLGMAKATENGPKIWKVLCKFAFVENSNKRVAEIWRPGHRWRDIKRVILE